MVAIEKHVGTQSRVFGNGREAVKTEGIRLVAQISVLRDDLISEATTRQHLRHLRLVGVKVSDIDMLLCFIRQVRTRVIHLTGHQQLALAKYLGEENPIVPYSRFTADTAFYLAKKGATCNRFST